MIRFTMLAEVQIGLSLRGTWDVLSESYIPSTEHVIGCPSSLAFLTLYTYNCLVLSGVVNMLSWFLACEAAIYNHVLEGNVLKAIELTDQLAVDLLASHPDVHFALLTLHFVELVRAKDWYDITWSIVWIFVLGSFIPGSTYPGHEFCLWRVWLCLADWVDVCDSTERRTPLLITFFCVVVKSWSEVGLKQ